jgi:TRAP transporter TAXI family solute receptor
MKTIALALLMISTAASAQVIGLGTTQVGATFQLATGIAKVVSDKAGIQMRTQPMAGAAQYAPLVNAGEIEFGISNTPELHYLIDGRVIIEGRKNPELRMVARLVPWYNGFVVKGDSAFKSLKDLRGQPVPYGFTGNPLGKVLVEGYLANAGLTVSDVRPVPVPSFPRMFDAFKQQQTATSIATLGSSQLKEWEAALGSVRYLPFDDSPAAVAAMAKFIPYGYVVQVPAGATGVPAPTKLLVYDYTLWANSKVSPDAVAKVVDALYSNADALKETSPLWKEFDPKLMSKELGVAYHPGAVKVYQAKGIWPGKK